MWKQAVALLFAFCFVGLVVHRIWQASATNGDTVTQQLKDAKIGILAATLLSAIAGAAILYIRPRKPA